MIFGGHLENMQIRSIKSHFSICQHWSLDSAYPNTPDSDLKLFSSRNAFPSKLSDFSDFFVLTKFGSINIKCDDEVKLLGIDIDFRLKFDQISNICKKAMQVKCCETDWELPQQTKQICQFFKLLSYPI